VASSEIGGQPLPEFFAVCGSVLTPLFKLDDAAFDLPVSGGEDDINRLRSGMACSVEQLGYSGNDLVIVRPVEQQRSAGQV
jgi:hypothetical protein